MALTVDMHVDMGEVVKIIRGFESRARGLDLSVYAEDVRTAVDDLIQAEGATAGHEKWTALSSETLRRHPRRIGGQILQATGLLANLQTIYGTDWFGCRSPAAYAGYHITGTKTQGGTPMMPKRDFLAIDFTSLLEQLATEMAGDVTR